MSRLSVFAALIVILSCTAQEEKQTSYPLMGIASIDPRIDEGSPDASDIINPEELRHYMVFHGGAVELAKDVAALQGFPLKSVVYTGGFTISSRHAPYVEEHFRSAMAMSPLARLSRDADRDASVLELDMGNDNEWPFHASTAGISSGRPGEGFCFWVRVGDELMKVVGTDPPTKTITVERGFEGTAPTMHETGDRVFGPVYVGNRRTLGRNARSSNTWPTSAEGIRYALDPGNPATHAYKAEFVIDKVKNGFSGIWWDTFQPSTYNLCDPIGRGGYGEDGRSIMYWDFANDQPYTPETLREAMKRQVWGVRQITREAAGIDPYLVANNMGRKYGLLHSMIEPDSLLDGFCFEDAFIHPEWESNSEGGKLDKRKLKFTFHPTSMEAWKEKMTQMSRAAREGKETYSMIGPAGYVLSRFNPSQSNFEQLRKFGWACFLLTVEASRTTMFGLPITFTTNSEGDWEILPLPDYFFWPIGDPAESGALDGYQVPSLPVWIRQFDKGIVLVSRLEEGKQAEIDLPGKYLDPVSGKKMNRVILTGTRGMILMK